MKSVWRKHLIICLVLGLLAIPIYFLDRALLSDGGGSSWINLDFRGLIFRTYLAVLGIGVILSSIAVLLFPNAKAWPIYLGSFVLALVLLITGLVTYGKLRRMQAANEYRKMMADRRPLMNVLELRRWWYVPDESHPTEIRVDVVTHQPGRFAGGVTGDQTDSSGSSTTIFEDTNGPETQRQVHSEEAFTYAFPLKFLRPGQADDVRITLYLFKGPLGPPVGGDITKIFMKSPQRDDDGQYFYGVLPPPSQPAK